jgi:hypothetical protein
MSALFQGSEGAACQLCLSLSMLNRCHDKIASIVKSATASSQVVTLSVMSQRTKTFFLRVSFSNRWGWSVFEPPGVEPVFPETRNDYAAFSRLTTFEDEDIESFLTFLELREKETRDGPNK